MICLTCRRRRHYHPEPCPRCTEVRPLAYLVDDLIVCASCAGEDSIFACTECGREDNLYASRRCARCVLRERLQVLLTDPRTGDVHPRLRPVFDELVSSERPQTGLWWLNKKPGTGPRLLAQMARGEIAISHDTFRELPSDRAHDYLRSLLASLGVLPPFEIRIERMAPWIAMITADLPTSDAMLIRQYANWHIMPAMRKAARDGRLTKAISDGSRHRIRAAVDLLAWTHARNVPIGELTQDQLETYLTGRRRRTMPEHGFVSWLRRTRINTRVGIGWTPQDAPEVIVSHEQRWAAVEQLLHDDSLRLYTRVGGLMTILFAQPLTRVVAMRTTQITDTGSALHVAFGDTPVQMPPVFDDLIRDHLARRGKSLYVSRDTGWLFPGGTPGAHLVTENIRSQLVRIGIKPYEHRKAALFQLATEVPAPLLADLIGITAQNAADWARLSARDWTGYIRNRSSW